MQRSTTITALALAAALALPGCYSVKYHVEDSPSPVEITAGAGRLRYHFKEEGRNYFLVYGLLPFWGDKTEALLAKHMIRGSRVSNLKITNQVTFTDVLVSLGVGVGLTLVLTPVLGMAAPYVVGPLGLGIRTTTLEGDVIDDVEAAQ